MALTAMYSLMQNERMLPKKAYSRHHQEVHQTVHGISNSSTQLPQEFGSAKPCAPKGGAQPTKLVGRT